MPASDPTTSGIYRILCIANGRIYIGSAANFADRWRIHRRDLKAGKHHSRHLQHAWGKYGRQGFVFEVIELVEDIGNLLAIEQEWLDRLRPYEQSIGFNVSPTAGSKLGVDVSEETRAKLSQRKREYFDDPVHGEARKAKQGDYWRGKKQSAEHRTKRREALLGDEVTAESRAKSSATQKGRVKTPEHRAKLAEALRGRKLPPEVVAKREETRKARGYKDSAETRAKKSEAANSRKKAVMIIETGQVFDSIMAASRVLGLHDSTINQAIRKDCRCNGWHWR
jgi:group I intron endonuclease